MHKKRYQYISLIIAIVTVASSFIIPIAFSAIDGFNAIFGLSFSHSCGYYGVPIITALLVFFAHLSIKGIKEKSIAFVAIYIGFVIVLGGAAELNEHVIKPIFKIDRPYALYLEKQYNFDPDAFYSLPTKTERTEYLTVFIETHEEELQQAVAPSILKHWAFETGFSFPSGHSLTAFLLATIFSHIYIYRQRKYMPIGLYSWAVLVALSRVAIGAHSALDITVGSLVGTSIGLIIIWTNVIDKFYTKKRFHRK